MEQACDRNVFSPFVTWLPSTMVCGISSGLSASLNASGPAPGGGTAEMAMEETGHARRRKRARGISEEEIDAALRFGEEIKQIKGRRAFWLTDRIVQTAGLPGDFAGVAVIIAPDGAIITVVRCHEGRGLRRFAAERAPGRQKRRSWAARQEARDG